MCRIRTLWRIGLTAAALATLATGCSDEAGVDQTFEADWYLRYVGAPNGPNISCDDAGTPTVLLEIRNAKNAGEFKDTFNCKDGFGVSAPHPPGEYYVRVTLQDSAQRPIAQWLGDDRTWPLRTRGSTYFGLPIQFDVQSFVAFWSIARGNDPVSCTQAGASLVRLRARIGEDAEPRVFDFPCTDGRGLTGAVPVGTYGVQMQLVAADKTTVLSQTPVETFVAKPNERATLKAVTFDVK